MILDRAALDKELKLKTEEVPVGSGKVLVTEVTALEYMEVYDSEAAKNDKGDPDGSKFTAALAVRCIVDKKGQRLYGDNEADLLRNGSSSVYTKLILAVKRVNGLGVDPIKN